MAFREATAARTTTPSHRHTARRLAAELLLYPRALQLGLRYVRSARRRTLPG
ncbi:hypothetical protein [Nocardia yunnanensis]|uniref:hypothetical protein n=1 Tax=Nocardia yunnanensis TaxID=2382165 RepID=UPI0013C4CF43|nr:hypothetical protein [Nocardia yunnanensis]